jgi:putative flippase GtrA
VRLEVKGRGRALKTVWSASDAQVLAYCDVDLSAVGALPICELGSQLGHRRLQTPVAGPPAAMTSQLARFAVIGFVSTVAYLVLYLALRGSMAAPWANLLALLICGVVNTTANRRITFGVRGRDRAARHQSQGLVVFALGLGLTSGALGLLDMVAPGAGPMVEVTVLILANAVATGLRFVLFRYWVFRATTRPTAPTRAPSTQTAA